jgi:hypothetical protein
VGWFDCDRPNAARRRGAATYGALRGNFQIARITGRYGKSARGGAMKLKLRPWRGLKEEMRQAREDQNTFLVTVYLFIINCAVWIVLFGLLLLAAQHLEWLINHFSVGWLATLIVAVSVVLFFVRRGFRLAYAELEITLGIFLVITTIRAETPDPSIDQRAFKIAAGMYLVIRGIDNFMTWLKPRIERCPPWIRYIFRSQ